MSEHRTVEIYRSPSGRYFIEFCTWMDAGTRRKVHETIWRTDIATLQPFYITEWLELGTLKLAHQAGASG